MYHLLTALLFKIGIKSENHSASIILLEDVFNLKNKEIYEAKKERIDKQYYVDFVLTKKEAEDTIKKAENFNNILIDFIAKINNEDIKIYREKFRKFLRN